MTEARRQNQSHDPGRVLDEHLSQGVTGCLSLRTRENAERRVYLMQGEILAAHGPDDQRAVLRRLVNNGAITESQSERLLERVAAGDGLDELLFGQVPDELLLDVLGMRFRQNLLDFEMGYGEPVFEPMEAVFVDNIQVGHDTRALLDVITGRCERIRTLLARQRGTRVLPGQGRPGSLDQARLLDLVGTGLFASELVALSPFEEGETLDLLIAMLELGVVSFEGHFPIDEEEPAELGDEALDLIDEDVNSVPPADLVPFELSPTQIVDQATLEVSAELTEMEEVAPEALAEFTEESAAQEAERVEHDTARLEHEAALRAELEADLAGSDAVGFAGGEHAVRPPGFDFDLPDSEEMAMFEDQDFYRGRGDGGYVTDRHNLDRVELVDAIDEVPETGEEPPIAVEDDSVLSPEERRRARTTHFSAPLMDEDEARAKSELVNLALHELARSYDEGSGPGSGKVFVQLLLEGTPAQFKPLFQGLEPDSDGRVAVAPVVRNLMSRPEAERRQLFQRAASDLFERALTLAYDDLDEELAEQVAEQVLEIERRLEKMS